MLQAIRELVPPETSGSVAPLEGDSGSDVFQLLNVLQTY